LESSRRKQVKSKEKNESSTRKRAKSKAGKRELQREERAEKKKLLFSRFFTHPAASSNLVIPRSDINISYGYPQVAK